MAKYIVKRVAMGIFSVFIVATLTFFIMNLVPGGPFVAEKSISKAAQQALAEKYGLDKPLGVQYLNYMNSLIHGDMGLSLKQRGRTVNQIIFSKLPVSARTAGLAVVVALCVGIPLGCLSAYNRGKWADNLIIVFATCGIAIPSFISSVVLLYTFGMNLKLLPTVGLNEPAAYIMPVTALAIYPTAYITRLMRSSLLDIGHEGDQQDDDQADHGDLVFAQTAHAVLPEVDALTHDDKAFLLVVGRGGKVLNVELQAQRILFQIFHVSAPPYFSLMRGSMILYRMSTTTFATMTRVASRIVVPMIIM